MSTSNPADIGPALRGSLGSDSAAASDPCLVSLTMVSQDEPSASRGRRASHPMSVLVSELTDAGYPVASVSELRDSGLRYAAAVPVLLKWLPIVPLSEKQGIVRALSVPWAKSQALDPLIAQYREEPVPSDPMGESLRWAVGNALEILWDDTRFDDLAALTADKRFGKAREMVVLGMGRSKLPKAVDVLIRHLDDPEVSGHAVKALGKLRDPRARAGLESMTTDKRTWVRKAAEKALSRLR